MKKALFLFSLILGLSVNTFAGNPYKVNQSSINEAFAVAKEVSLSDNDLANMHNSNFNAIAEGEQTREGYLVRAFFCGGIALHRQYMGSDWSKLWWKYFCIPVVGGVTACVDFWWVIFEQDALAKYKGNNSYMVWNESK
jgi:hypothetical protein